jgi:FlaA1/EpsC-like NDP-sugar epimerase
MAKSYNETLCTREEMIKAEDMGEFYRVPADNRDLNYAQYFSEGNKIYLRSKIIIHTIPSNWVWKE